MKQGQANGSHRVVLEIGPDGMPRPPVTAEPELPVRIYLPENKRGSRPAELWPDPQNGEPLEPLAVGLKRLAEAEPAIARNGKGSDANADDESAEDEE